MNEEMSRFDVDGARRARPRTLSALGRLLLGPVADRLARLGGGRLVVVPDGALQYIPFGALR